MAILAGIDEAGLGPTLGPLVVSGVAFRVDDDRIGHCLWDSLKTSCTSTTKRTGRRLPVADSKKLFQARKSLAALERTALVMLAVSGRSPKTLRTLLETVAPGAAKQLNEYPWYLDADMPLPTDDGVGDIATQANAVRRDGTQNGVVLAGVYTEPLLAGHYNRLVKNTRNKSVVLLGLALRVVHRVMQSAPGERIRLHVDRLGGRKHYREALMTALQGDALEILEESDERSAYRLVHGSRTCEIDFVIKGEGRHFPVALASIYSKYIRELFMLLFNRYWCERVGGLRPTAGYYTDARRWLGDVAQELKRRPVDRDALVRVR